ncbi:MAG TPA: magnesium transporter [Crocinitomicaceae bacterium]|nr:magnesium transporter [Crocinitomicaceae bacterium]
MHFEKTKEYMEELLYAIQNDDANWINENLATLHFADIADILEGLDVEQAKYVYYHLDEDTQADVLVEFEEHTRDRFIASLSNKEIAEQLENLDSDDAADILGEFENEKIQDVISHMEDDDAAEDIVDLLNYAEDTAGGLMQKEFITARIDWPVDRCLVELRRQAKNVEKVYTIYVVDLQGKLVGVLSLKSLLFAKPKTKISELYKPKNVISVKTTDSGEVVSKVMEKYDLVSIPVVDFQNKLVGRITIDDVVDYIKEEADKDFQMASGLSEAVEHNSSIWKTSRARLLWLFIGMFGGTISAHVISGYEVNIGKIPALAFFIPLITAMGGNVGVQSSAIVVQSLARGVDFSNISKNLLREALVGLLNGAICSTVILGIATYLSNFQLGFTVSLSLMIVILFAAVAGSLIPLVMNKYKIDPALATGPFVTTMNDIIGLFIYFYVSTLLVGLS